jgi:excinuclease UvrABC nuclease subunit
VLVFDFAGSPRPYRPIYFGKTENLSERVTSSHEKYSEWRAACQSLTGLHLAYHVMRDSSDWQRSTLERNLIAKYAPRCNDVFNPFAGLLGL